jgi:hypothetical protein
VLLLPKVYSHECLEKGYSRKFARCMFSEIRRGSGDPPQGLSPFDYPTLSPSSGYPALSQSSKPAA